jgi:bifunctional DNase/RNase
VASPGNEVKVEVVGVFQQEAGLPGGEEGTPLLILRDQGSRELQVPIGSCEGLAIRVALQQHIAARPLTHDLALRLLDRLSSALQRVVIDDLSDRTFHATLHLLAGEEEISLAAGPGDAVALALRAEVPIYATEEVFVRASETGDGL